MPISFSNGFVSVRKSRRTRIALGYGVSGLYAALKATRFTLATVAVAVAATGPGRFSIDRLIGWDDNISGVWWGAGVAAAALAISFLTVTVLRHRQVIQEQPAA